MLSDKPDGKNINANCGSTHMENLMKYVADNKLDLGVAFDGDADRCLAVDENGNMVDGDFIMAICAMDLASRNMLKKNTAARRKAALVSIPFRAPILVNSNSHSMWINFLTH